jgi:O-antigen ligase/polysaccharide polymerase Wzy-like membrane protein
MTPRDAALGSTIAVALVALCAANGGYFPTAWGVAALALLWCTTLALLRERAAISGAEVAMLSALGALLVLSAFSGSAGASGEALRTLTYFATVLAVLTALWSRRVVAISAGIVAGVSLVALYALATRLLPDRLGGFDPVAAYRLAEPLGYWNALGILAVIGLLLALGLSTAGSAPAALPIPVLATTVFFTYSRGALLAGLVGFAAFTLLTQRRAGFVTKSLLLVLPAVAAVAFASQADALTTRRAAIADAIAQGHRLAVVLAVLSAASVGVALATNRVTARIRLPRIATVSAGIAYALAAVVVAIALLIRTGGPVDAFSAAPPRHETQLNQRFLTFSGTYRAELWTEAIGQFERHPLIGSGAGTFEAQWLEHRPIPHKVRDAHSLYLETLGELGIVGLALLLTALLVPAYGALKARRRPLVPAAFGAYVAYLVHAGLDWDWEMPAVTLTALFLGAALVVAARDPNTVPRLLSPRARAGALAITLASMVAAFVGLVGNMALSQSARAARAGDWVSSVDYARRAETWAPWSAEPYRHLGDAELALAQPSRARASYKEALLKAPNDWSLWFDLARASTGRQQREALGRAAALNPLSPEVAQFRQELSQAPIAVVRSRGLR